MGGAKVNCGGHLEIHADIHNVIFVMLGNMLLNVDASCEVLSCTELLYHRTIRVYKEINDNSLAAVRSTGPLLILSMNSMHSRVD